MSPSKPAGQTESSQPNQGDAQNLKKSERLAYFAANYAEGKRGGKLKAWEVHDFWTGHGFDAADRDTQNAADLAGYEIPDLTTYQTQLSRARTAFNDRRHEPRANRKGRSVAKREQID